MNPCKKDLSELKSPRCPVQYIRERMMIRGPPTATNCSFDVYLYPRHISSVSAQINISTKSSNDITRWQNGIWDNLPLRTFTNTRDNVIASAIVKKAIIILFPGEPLALWKNCVLIMWCVCEVVQECAIRKCNNIPFGCLDLFCSMRFYPLFTQFLGGPPGHYSIEVLW